MFNGTLYSLYLLVFVVLLLPFVVVSKDDEINGKFKAYGIHSYTLNEITPAKKEPSGSLTEIRTYSLAEALRRTFTEFEILFENVIQIVALNVPQISRDTEIFLAKLANRTMNALDVFSNKIIDTGDSLLNEMFSNVERQLESVKDEFQNLAVNVDDHFEWAVNQLNQTLMNNTAEYDYWTARFKHKLRSVNDTKLYKDGCKAIDEFIYNSSKELQNCCKITMKPMRSLCKNAGSLLTEALHIIVDAIDRMQTCLEDKNSYLEYLVPCINLAYDDISGLVSRAAQVRHQVNNMLPMKIIYTKSCFAIVMVDMKHRRNTIESNLLGNEN